MLYHMQPSAKVKQLVLKNDIKAIKIIIHSCISPLFLEHDDKSKCERTTFADIQPTHVSFNNLILNTGRQNQLASDGRTLSCAWSFFEKPCALNLTPNPVGSFNLQRWLHQDQTDKKSKQNEPAKTKAEQLKSLVAQYGGFAAAVHIILSLASLGFFYLLVSSGIDIVAIFQKMGIELSSTLGEASNLLIAYTVHKVIMPVRISLTVVTVPVLVRYFRKLGYLKKK
uniref:DUF1279 domain-containing protein n=1 Tax=Ciona savignyi TaxID=51511 RepID=H2YFK7_CIOSA